MTDRRSAPVENSAYGQFATRIVRSYGRRVAAHPDELADLAELAREVERATHVAVAGARANGLSWSEVGALLGITKQAAQQRFGRTQAAYDELTELAGRPAAEARDTSRVKES